MADGNLPRLSVAASDGPISSSIAYGVIAGVCSYVLINSVPWVLRKVSNGKISPPKYDVAEPWVVPPGGMTPPWM